jgi:hypothetical protein
VKSQRLLRWTLVSISLTLIGSLQAQSLQWADLDQNGNPTGTFVQADTLTFLPVNPYLLTFQNSSFGNFNPGDTFTGNLSILGPGNSNALPLGADYRLEATLMGSISHTANEPSNLTTVNLIFHDSHLILVNNHTNETIADFSVLSGTASLLPSCCGTSNFPGELQLTAALYPGCTSCDKYIHPLDNHNISSSSIITTLNADFTRTPTNPNILRFGSATSSTFAAFGPPQPIGPQVTIAIDNVLESNNGNPMRTLLAPGQSSVGTVGTAGRNDHEGFSGNLGSGQLRFAHNFGFAQFNVSGGGLWNNNDTFKGDTTLRGAYVVPEVITKIPQTTIHLTATGIYSPGQVNPDISTLGGRVRLDWLDAIKIHKTAFTPYASYTYIHTTVASFMDKSVPFLWDNHSEQVNTGRYGLDAVIGVTARINLLARVEGSHRFESHSSATSGQIIGGMTPTNLNFSGQVFKQDWMRGAVGVEGKLGKHFVGLLLNATSQGPVTGYWVTASYRAAF